MPEESMKRIKEIQTRAAGAGVGCFLVPISDPALNEYVPERWMFVKHACGFTGSSGLLIAGAKGAALVTDSRYWEQAEKELPAEVALVRQSRSFAEEAAAYIEEHGYGSAALDPRLWSASQADLLEQKLESMGASLKFIPVEEMISWPQRPKAASSPILPLQEPLDEVHDKIRRVRVEMKKISEVCGRAVQGFLACAWDEAAWLTNLRSSDVEYNPVFESYLMLGPDFVELFVDPSRLSSSACDLLEKSGIEIVDIASIDEALSIPRDGWLVDDEGASRALLDKLNGDWMYSMSPIKLVKSRKTPAELAGIRRAVLEDGACVVEALARFEELVQSGALVDEMTLAEILAEERRRVPGFITESFGTISAFGPNAAQPHYAPSREKCSRIDGSGMLLLDSGGHFATGTTDATRMIPVGTPSPQMKKDVSLVVKAMFRLLSAKLPIGATGRQADVICRSVLWRSLCDYGHGTGHGVGCVLNVHEGPVSISPRARDLPLEEGNVLSNEPGLYRSGRWGVRVENMMAARICADSEFGRFISFEPLTMIPIDSRLVDVEELGDEKAAFEAYNRTVAEALAPLLSRRARAYLEKIS